MPDRIPAAWFAIVVAFLAFVLLLTPAAIKALHGFQVAAGTATP